MKKYKILLIFVSCLALAACQSVKDGLSGSKSENSDEFLVQKKNPLVLPPKYLELPKPNDSISKDEKASLSEDNLNIKEMLGIEEAESKNLPSTQNGDVEEFVLKNIKND